MLFASIIIDTHWLHHEWSGCIGEVLASHKISTWNKSRITSFCFRVAYRAAVPIIFLMSFLLPFPVLEFKVTRACLLELWTRLELRLPMTGSAVIVYRQAFCHKENVWKLIHFSRKKISTDISLSKYIIYIIPACPCFNVYSNHLIVYN